VLSIKELGKPRGEKCPHQASGIGCSIYVYRPRECREYRCGWLLGFGADEDRPDRSGVVASLVHKDGELSLRVAISREDADREAVTRMLDQIGPRVKIGPISVMYV
jgi:hypothetical protein